MDNKEKIIALYKYIKDLASLKMRIVTDIDKQTWTCALGDIPIDSENVSICYRDRVDNDDSTRNDELIKIHKPQFQACPQPDKIFFNWLEDGWDKFQNDVKMKEIIVEDIDEASDKDVEKFEDSKSRVDAFEKWVDLRNKWVEKQKIIFKTRRFFTRLYQLHTDLERESETTELIIGDGILKDSKNEYINHPVLLRRVKTSFDARSNTIYILDTDTDSELYTILFQEMSDINHSAIKSLKEELQENDYHPLDRNDAHDFLKILVHRLSPESKYAEKADDAFFGNGDRLLMYSNPVLFVRKRIDGALKAIEQIIENIESTGYIPPHLIDIVDAGLIEIPEDKDEPTIEKQLAAVGGEDIEILLSKETNKEQLEIAQRIERYNAVLVQGPPGTGKTHTIANLLGHFLAQGKSVLVTSHTKKALTVLKEKVVSGLKDLCVSVLDDTNIDMERSVDGISDYLSRNTSNELKRKIDIAARQRIEIINSLSDVRKKIFTIKYREFKSIVINGDSISPSEAAKYVNEYAEQLSYIPGKVTLYHTLPLTFEELASLYRSNVGVSSDEEQELKRNLPNPKDLLLPDDFKKSINEICYASDRLKEFEANGILVETNVNNDSIHINLNEHVININKPSSEAVHKLKEYISTFKKIEGWIIYAAVDGRKGGSYKSRWNLLIEQIKSTCAYAESLLEEQFGKNIVFTENIETLTPIIIKMKEILAKKEKLSKIDRILNKNFEIAEKGISISGQQVSSSIDCTIVLNQIELICKRKQCGSYWDSLLSIHGVPKFQNLDSFAPEDIAANWIDSIERYLCWYESEYNTLCSLLECAGISPESIFKTNQLDSEIAATQKILNAIEKTIPNIISVCDQYFLIRNCENKLSDCLATTLEGERKYSVTCNRIGKSISNKDYSEYESAYLSLVNLYEKYALQQLRIEYLNRLYVHAPEWAEAIKERDGIHGLANVPIDIVDAWKWKQYAGIISDITSEPYEELQAKSVSLSKSYRERTATLAELNAWYHLLLKTERNIDMKQALQGWKLTVRKIGKGTGKNAPMLKAEARKLMAKCQTAVPAWIMPVNKALESLDPRKNQFDVIIIDEASQSDISALSIAYMAKKLIIVGDDKQVSPMAVGIDIERMNNLVEMYIKNTIPNWHLFNATSSLYDIAGTTFQPLMLREHFRCVPDIIGFSNKLSYDFKIKPLRDSSNNKIVPAVVNYSVDAGARDPRKKTNFKEAQAIVALMMACMELSEYEGKTFGVISLLGDEQARLIQNMLIEYLEPAVLDTRRILCGNASHFQGDERDVLFLSLVDSNSEDGPLRLMGAGIDDSNKKRYNVAASRAKDQLWVISSLDVNRDLKPGDLRKELLDYASNPKYYTEMAGSIEKLSESPFEKDVCKVLVAKGYHVVQQWPVGAYRIDMVIVYENKKIALECDGELYHSGEDKVREDMERQAILARLGWSFIRIRGSEFYRDPDRTMERVIAQIEKNGIYPENSNIEANEPYSELYEKIKTRASQFLDEWKNNGTINEETALTVEFALDNKTTVDSNKTIQGVDANPNNPIRKQSKNKGANAEMKNSVAQFEQLKLIDIEIQKSSKDYIPPKKVGVATNSKNKIIHNIFEYLNELGAEYIDNSEKSSIIWVVYTPGLSKEFANNIKIRFDASCQYEGRGSKATSNRPAWRINL